MKKIFLTLMIGSLSLSCNAQNEVLIDLSNNSEMNYIFARINPENITFKELYNRGLFAVIYQISDSKATPENFSEGTEEFLVSYIISIIPDGDYYTGSKLYKLEGLVNPKILEINETSYPKLILKIEQGDFDKRKIKIFELDGKIN